MALQYVLDSNLSKIEQISDFKNNHTDPRDRKREKTGSSLWRF
jgi:hypothetical protein